MNLEAYTERLKEAAKQGGFTCSSYGTSGDIELPVLERHSHDNAPQIYISAGVHGDEPAPPMAILELLRRKAFPLQANLTLFPLINPTGLMAGTRENRDGIDLNRDYGLNPQSTETKAQLDWIGSRNFGLTLCLHEDFDGQGFYVYAHSRNENDPDYASIAIEAAKPYTGIDQRTEIDEMPARNGRMLPPMDVMDKNRPDLPEALRLLFHHEAQVSITTETPSDQPLTSRIEAQCQVVLAVIKTYLNS